MPTHATVRQAASDLLHVEPLGDLQVIRLHPEAPFEALRDAVRAWFGRDDESARRVDARLDIGPRPIDLFDLRRLVHILREEFNVHVTGLYCTAPNLQRFAERELKLKVFLPEPAEQPAPASAPEPPPPPAERVEEVGSRLLTLRRSVRSGTEVRFAGDVVVFGDINPGGQVVADGNVLVFGAVKGLVHAGAGGDEDAVIVGFDLRPTQVRIAHRIALPPDQQPRRRGRVWAPELARVAGDQIVIEPYEGRLPGQEAHRSHA